MLCVKYNLKKYLYLSSCKNRKFRATTFYWTIKKNSNLKKEVKKCNVKSFFELRIDQSEFFGIIENIIAFSSRKIKYQYQINEANDNSWIEIMVHADGYLMTS